MSNLRSSALRFARGTVLSQILLAAATPLLTRLYAPSDFGDLALFVSIVVLIAPLSTMKYDQAILLPRTREGAEFISITALWWSVLTSAAIVAGALALQAFGIIHLRWTSFLAPLILPIVALVSVAQQWSSREKRFSEIGTGLFVNAGTNIVFSCLFVAIGLSRAGLILGYVSGFAASAVYFVSRHGTPLPHLSSHLKVRVSEIRSIVSEYRDFPLYVLPNTLLGYLAYQSMPILLAHFFDTTTTGLYSVANRLVVLPSLLGGQVFGEIFRSEFVTRLHSGADYKKFFEKVFLWLIALIVPVYGLVLLLSPLLFHIVFGEKFIVSGDYARYICLGVVGNFLVQMFSYVLVAIGRTRAGLFFQVVISVGQIVGFLVGALQHDIRMALIGMSVTGFVLSGIFVFFAYDAIIAYTKQPRMDAKPDALDASGPGDSEGLRPGN